MPRIIVVPFVSSNSALPVLSLVEPPIPLPEVWNQLRCWFDTAYVGSYSIGVYAANHPVTAWRNADYVQMMDASSRVGWVPQVGTGPYNIANRYAVGIPVQAGSATGAPGPYPLLLSYPEQQINGKSGYCSSGYGQYMNTTFGTAVGDYTYILTYKAAANSLGALFGSGGTLNSDTDAVSAIRFGFSDTVNGGNTLFQHSNVDKLVIARNTANEMPTLAIIRCSYVGGVYVGSVRLVNSGTTTDHAFTFTTRPTIGGHSFGKLGTVASSGTLSRIGVSAVIGRKITDAEQTYLTSWMQANRGPF